MQADFQQRVLANFDVGAMGSAFRIGLGLLLVPVLECLSADPGPWAAVAGLLALLFAVKVVAAVARRVIPASDVVRANWERRRALARNYDSYQWRKLLWFGVGLLLGASLGWPGSTIQWALGIVCVAAGSVAELRWRRQGVADERSG